jgi:uncharacterized CHY-type Zn-finger protein
MSTDDALRSVLTKIRDVLNQKNDVGISVIRNSHTAVFTLTLNLTKAQLSTVMKIVELVHHTGGDSDLVGRIFSHTKTDYVCRNCSNSSDVHSHLNFYLVNTIAGPEIICQDCIKRFQECGDVVRQVYP